MSPTITMLVRVTSNMPQCGRRLVETGFFSWYFIGVPPEVGRGPRCRRWLQVLLVGSQQGAAKAVKAVLQARLLGMWSTLV